MTCAAPQSQIFLLMCSNCSFRRLLGMFVYDSFQVSLQNKTTKESADSIVPALQMSFHLWSVKHQNLVLAICAYPYDASG